jgi:hypothetical protein
VQGRGTHLRSEGDVHILVGALVSRARCRAWRRRRRSSLAPVRKRAQVGECRVDEVLALCICDGQAARKLSRDSGTAAGRARWGRRSAQKGFQMAAHPASHCTGAPFAQFDGSAQHAALNWSDIETKSDWHTTICASCADAPPSSARASTAFRIIPAPPSAPLPQHAPPLLRAPPPLQRAHRSVREDRARTAAETLRERHSSCAPVRRES